MATTSHPALAANPIAALDRQPAASSRVVARHLLAVFAVWFAVFALALSRPPLLDDADATHAQAAQAMLATGDLVTLHVDGIRYLEKAPLPYWIAAASLRLFGGYPAFAMHLPLALTVLALALLGYAWARRAFGDRAALYTALFTLTATGVFLFTRIFIPDALLSLLLALTLYALLGALNASSKHSRRYAHLLWTALALAVLTKGLVAIAFGGITAVAFLVLTHRLRAWRTLVPWTGPLVFLAIAAPWHVLAGLRNTSGANGHGFFWFYFVNEHLLRFLGRRIPRDYNKLPAVLYWALHLVWLFPWSFFAPLGLVALWRRRSQWRRSSQSFAAQTVVLLLTFSAIVLVFFSFSTNQEYYTFPAYLPLLMLLAAAVALPATDALSHRCLHVACASLTAIGVAIAVALGWGLWSVRHAAFVPDIGAVLAHRGVGDYTLSLSHFFDLTGPSFAALRLPAFLAAVAFAVGPALAWGLYANRRLHAAVLTLVATSVLFLIAAHVALVRFAPMLSSESFAATILQLESQHRIEPATEVLLYGDQAFGSSLPFYLHRRVLLVDGRSTSMLFGSTFADAPPIFRTPQQLLAEWGQGPRKILFVPLERRDEAQQLLRALHPIMLAQSSGKILLTDRPIP